MKKQVLEFISKIENDRRKADSEVLVALIEEEFGYQPYLHFPALLNMNNIVKTRLPMLTA